MSLGSKQTWIEIIKFVATVLTAIVGALGVAACGR